MSQATYVGIDVSKKNLDVALNTGEVKQFSNNDEGIVELRQWLAGHSPELIVLEATGGLEAAAALGLQQVGMAVAVVNPRQTRDFGRAMGILAKTDALDARVLASFAERLTPEPRPLADGDQKALADLAKRRRQLQAAITREQNQRRTAHGLVKPSHDRIIASLKKELKEVDKDISNLLMSAEDLQRKVERLKTIPGVGDISARGIVGLMPELGTLNPKEVASLVGLAPHNRDSGQMRGKRSIWGGRKALRCILYMPTLVAIRWCPPINAFYKRIISQGKSAKVAITACMRKLLIMCNAIMRDQTTWQARSVC